MTREVEYVEVEVVIQSEREKAWAVSDGTTEMYKGKEQLKWFWLPKSQCHDIETNKENNVTKMRIPEWLAKEKEMI